MFNNRLTVNQTTVKITKKDRDSIQNLQVSNYYYRQAHLWKG